jgi:hypothetical protein
MLRSLKWIRNKSTTLAYKCVNRVGPQNAESMNNIFNIRDTEVDICGVYYMQIINIKKNVEY